MEDGKRLYSEIGDRIRSIREEQSKTREQVAEAAGISSQFLFDIETGRKSMTVRTIIGISKALNISTDYILIGQESSVTRASLLLEGLPQDQIDLAIRFLTVFRQGAKHD